MLTPRLIAEYVSVRLSEFMEQRRTSCRSDVLEAMHIATVRSSFRSGGAMAVALGAAWGRVATEPVANFVQTTVRASSFLLSRIVGFWYLLEKRREKAEEESLEK